MYDLEKRNISIRYIKAPHSSYLLWTRVRTGYMDSRAVVEILREEVGIESGTH